MSPAELIANKLSALVARKGKAKAGTDYRDLYHLLLTFPELKTEHGPVRERLEANGVEPAVINLWHEWVHRTIEPENDEDEFNW